MQERIGQIGDYWLSKRAGSEQWCRTWFDPVTRQTRRASVGTGDLQEAKVRLWQWYAANGRLERQDAQDTALELVLVRYWEKHAKALASAETAFAALGYWSDFFPGATVSEITTTRQREFMESLEASGKSPGYIKRIMGVGAAALNRAHKEGEIASAPYILPGEDAPPKDLVLSVDDSVALWLATELPHERMMLALLYGTLARPEAALDLRREFVDFDRRLLTQNPPGRKQTRKYRPVVPIAGFLLSWLEAAPAGPLVAWRGKPIASFKTAWRALRRRAGLSKEAVPKTIRHTMATHLRASDVPEAEIQGILGHRAYGGRTEVYAKYRPDYLGEAVQAVDAYMAEVTRRVLAAC